MKNLELLAIENIPLIEPGDDLVSILIQTIKEEKIKLRRGDILVIAQKVVSKSENRYVYLNDVTPSSEAIRIAKNSDKDPKLVQLILNESVKVIRQGRGVIVVENKLGFIHANAGIDKSNIESDTDNPKVLLLPKDPDNSALKIKEEIFRQTELKVGIIINDSSGRAWRKGIVGIAIGSSGVEVLLNLRGQKDLYGNALEITEVGRVDEIASAASLLMGQANEGLPVIIVRGIPETSKVNNVKSILRDKSEDLFR
ncbi:MAG: coenzyme F420-0:L-glutamate ligase [Pseudomonadota bacterium]|nr:coenzyme F420-0:L-glutamate ligase [Pseudomonadota bacterium]